VAVGQARGRGVNAAVLDLESGEIEGDYSAALCLDILQHSPYPLDLLAKVAGAVRAGGTIIISLPNEFHILRRLAVLFGRTRFARYDGPHPRLFWKGEAVRLARDAGLTVEKAVPLSLVPPRRRILRPAGKALARALPSLMAIGYVVKATKRSGA
jgi:2-polyprenyl-3-methyl-5-hydroxy-6-metoxy-1,4-benzoquinol methylase